jgi:hypothetical protein
MHPYGTDRTRAAGGDKVILQSRHPKGWTARVPAQGTHSEFPGTAVYWNEQYFEVIEATPQQTGGVRYVLAPWAEHHTIRTFEHYDEATEAARIADFERAKRQQKASTASRYAGFLLGHLPRPVQDHLQNELGVMPSRMTMLSCVPSMFIAGLAIYLNVDAFMSHTVSPVPRWFTPFTGLLIFDSLIRFFVAMSQHRGMGSIIGTPLYILYWYVAPHREKLPRPFEAKGESTTFTIPPPDDVALRDSLEMKGPLLTLLTPAEQATLFERYGFEYRRHCYGITWGFLVFAILGVVTSWMSMQKGEARAVISLLAAGAVAVEQILRLHALQKRPAGSMFAILVRPFVRDLLTARN